MDREGWLIAGSVDAVIDKIRAQQKETGFGNLRHDLVTRNLRLCAAEVAHTPRPGARRAALKPPSALEAAPGLPTFDHLDDLDSRRQVDPVSPAYTVEPGSWMRWG
jgi:hypothetical protein